MAPGEDRVLEAGVFRVLKAVKSDQERALTVVCGLLNCQSDLVAERLAHILDVFGRMSEVLEQVDQEHLCAYGETRSAVERILGEVDELRTALTS